jgi:TolC family type I secretion outer membrane protein
MKSSRQFAILTLLGWLLLAGPARAFDLEDPLRTRSALESRDATGVCAPFDVQKPLTLDEVVAQALCGNPQTQESYAAIEAQAAALGSARAAWLPTVNASLGHSITDTSNAQAGEFVSTREGEFYQSSGSLGLSWLLYDFGARTASRDNAQALLDAALASHDRDVQTVLSDALQAYYQLRTATAQQDAAREAEKTSSASLDAAETRHGVGVSTPADVLQARTAHAQAVLARIQAQGGVAIARGQLASSMGLDAHQPLALATDTTRGPATAPSVYADALIAQARRHRPDLVAAEAQVRAAKSDIAAAQASGRPTLRFSASESLTETEDRGRNERGALGLTLSIPLFTGFDTTYRVQAAEARLRGAEAGYASLSQQVALDVWTAYQQLKTAEQTVTSTAALLASAGASQDVALGRYKAGVGTVLDLLSAQSALADARQQQVAATYNLDVARANLALSLGALDPQRVSVGLPRPVSPIEEKRP